MLTNTTSMRFNYLRRIMVLPLFATVLVLFAFKLEKDDKEVTTVTATKAFKLVVDAGHGGKDNGVVRSDNVTEKKSI